MISLLLTALLSQVQLFVSFVQTSSFPQPLDEAEERRQLELMAQGDEQARGKLIEHNLRMVAHVVKKFDRTTNEVDDLISIGTIGLIKAVNSYTSDKGTRLATYAARCIENEIRMYYRSRRRSRGDISINDPIGHDKEGNEMTIADVLATDDLPVVEQAEQSIAAAGIGAALKELTVREREVVERRFGLYNEQPETQQMIADDLGISRSYVSRIEKRALERLIAVLGLEYR